MSKPTNHLSKMVRLSGDLNDMDKVTKLLSDFTELRARGYVGTELATSIREYRQAIGVPFYG